MGVNREFFIKMFLPQTLPSATYNNLYKSVERIKCSNVQSSLKKDLNIVQLLFEASIINYYKINF